MPGYYQRPLGGHLPLTPPDSGSGYSYRSVQYPQDSYVPHQNVSQSRHESGYDYQQGYIQPFVAPAPPPYPYQPASYQSTTSLPPIQPSYEQAGVPVGAPILPPIRVHEHAQFSNGYQRRMQPEQQSSAVHEQHRHAPKEEKATGGVSAKLDYDMERMTDFVADAAQSVFGQWMQSRESFRKWVHQVLSATRLPSATILLSLHYLNDRVVRFPTSIAPGENQIYRMLAVALILGSKFLDDNTFINRSWSDVTAIKVAELNMLEMKWLHLIQYQLHVDPSAANGLQGWIDSWKQHDADQAAKQSQIRLSPLDTNVHRHNTAREHYSPYPTPFSASSRSYAAPLSSRPQHAQYSNNSYSAVDSWTAASDRGSLDDFYKRQHQFSIQGDADEANRRASEERARQSAYGYPPSAHPSYYQTPTYASPWDQNRWNASHRYDCNCQSCGYQQTFRPYAMTSSYATQTVMG